MPGADENQNEISWPSGTFPRPLSRALLLVHLIASSPAAVIMNVAFHLLNGMIPQVLSRAGPSVLIAFHTARRQVWLVTYRSA
jgi:hypothetical protein